MEEEITTFSDFNEISILYLCPRYLYLNKTSRVRFHAVEAISKFCHVIWSGTGWDNWDGTKTVQENIDILYRGKKKPDIVFCHKPNTLKKFSEIQLPSCVSYNEMDTVERPLSERRQEIVDNKFDLVIAHHKNEMEYPEFQSLPCKMVNISHCAEKTIFKDYQLRKNTDVLLVGQIQQQRYPLRYRLSNLILKMRVDKQLYSYRMGILSHPGGRIKDANSNQEAIRFAKKINSAKICLTCSGVYRCRYGKYAEIPACRSLLVADLPDEDHEFFEQFMAVIDSKESDEEIMEKIVYYLENEEERIRLTDIGYTLTQKQFTQEHYAQRFLQAVRDFLKDSNFC